jgi:shikimate kinase
LKNHLFLTGFMGVGKSYFGRRLAEQVHVSFLDVDYEIQTREGRSIRRIFSEEGEEFFRSLERKLLLHFLNDPSAPSVIALGGGSLLNTDLIPEIKKAGLLVCLQRRSLALPIHLKKDRPLAVTHNVESLYRNRITGYSSAYACLRVDLFSEKDVISHLINLWNYQELDS